jgi:hypothetical protein
MSTVAGAFSETVLLNQRVLAEQISFDDRIVQQFKPQFEILNAVKAAQTAQVLTPLAQRKDVDVTVMWENFCEIAADTCGEDCTIGGTKSSTNTKDYAITFCKEVGFSMDENDFIDNEFDMNVAKALLMADKSLTEAFAQYAVAQIESFKGANALTTGKGVVVGNDTYIDPAYWTPAIAAYLTRCIIMNKLTNPVFASGSLLWEQYYVAQANNANANGKGDFNLWSGFQPYFDMWNVDSVNEGTLKAYLISQGALAMANKTYNPAVPQRTWDFTRYTMPSRWLPGMSYDVFYNNECVGTNKLIQHNYTVRFKGDIFLNPLGCDQLNTGVLAFICGNYQA